MDFSALLTVAQQNEVNKQPVACYQTKFAPPKKQTKQSKLLSHNIKKFLARKEEEAKQKADEQRKKKEHLLALRDHKAQSRINKHLKVCKAANKSVLADAIDNDNTAITIAGPSQPDEDDYGYVSHEASALYNQLMSKYNNMPQEKPIFVDVGKKTIKDIASTKDRVKQALKQEQDESSGHRRKRKINEKPVTEKVEEEIIIEQPKPKKKAHPTPLDFGALLKLAEKKQHEPVVIPVKPKIEEERLRTKRQMKEYLKEKEWRERKEQRDKQIDINKKMNVDINKKTNIDTNKKTNITNSSSKPNESQTLNKVPKVNTKSPSLSLISDKSSVKDTPTIIKKNLDKYNDKCNTDKTISNNICKNVLAEERKKLEAEKKQLEEMRRAIEEEKRQLAQQRNKQEDLKSSNKIVIKTKTTHKQVPSKDNKPTSDLKPHSLSLNKPKQFPPPDMRPAKSKQIVKQRIPNKRRIYDEEEYDSDLEDFIDDNAEDGCEDYSKYISEIFGYDKNKYKHLDDEDDVVMESNFAQQLKEEYVSTKIGIMEDLEDIRSEALEKRRKAISKKKSRK